MKKKKSLYKRSRLYKPYAEKLAEMLISAKPAFEELKICQAAAERAKKEFDIHYAAILKFIENGIKEEIELDQKRIDNYLLYMFSQGFSREAIIKRIYF